MSIALAKVIPEHTMKTSSWSYRDGDVNLGFSRLGFDDGRWLMWAGAM